MQHQSSWHRSCCLSCERRREKIVLVLDIERKRRSSRRQSQHRAGWPDHLLRNKPVDAGTMQDIAIANCDEIVSYLAPGNSRTGLAASEPSNRLKLQSAIASINKDYGKTVRCGTIRQSSLQPGIRRFSSKGLTRDQKRRRNKCHHLVLGNLLLLARLVF